MSDTVTEPSDAPAKVYICPACGLRYDEPTLCAATHPPTETVEYDRATVEAADGGDAAAQAAIAEATAAAGVGSNVGAVEGETAVGPAVEGDVTPPAAPAAENQAGDVPPDGTPPGGATDAPAAEAPAATEVFPAPVEPAPPAAEEPAAAESAVTDVSESPAPAPAAAVTVTVSGVTYSGTIPAA